MDDPSNNYIFLSIKHYTNKQRNKKMEYQLTGPTRKASMLAIFTATALSTNYLMIGLINVKFMDMIVFLGGFLFGTGFGVQVGVLTWLVYGTINPYGFNLPTLFATMIGEALYGVAGGLSSNRLDPSRFPYLEFALIGFLTTFLYDLFTNIATAYITGIPLIITLVNGIPFALVHEFSNAAFFGFGVIPVLRTVRRVFGDVF
jgi:hypothetical protein